MGGCLGCCCGRGGDELPDKESELMAMSNHQTNVSNEKGVSATMSSPTIVTNEERDVVWGTGLALVGVVVEQDAAYWEWHIEEAPTPSQSSTQTSTPTKPFSNGQTNSHSEETDNDNDDNNDNENDNTKDDNEDFFADREDDEMDDDDDDTTYGPIIKFGVATKKNQRFYKALAANDNDHDENDSTTPTSTSIKLTPTQKDDGTSLMRSIRVKAGDTVGIALQQSDLPMVQFLLNGEPLSDKSINRFRGSVHPSLYIGSGGTDGPHSTDTPNPNNPDSTYKVKLVCEEYQFRELAPHARFGPLLVARGII